MTARQYIDKHGLTLVRTYSLLTDQSEDGIAHVLVHMGDGDDPDSFEIYANQEKTVCVSINTTRNVFRLVHCELDLLYSDWRSMDADVPLPPLEI